MMEGGKILRELPSATLEMDRPVAGADVSVVFVLNRDKEACAPDPCHRC